MDMPRLCAQIGIAEGSSLHFTGYELRDWGGTLRHPEFLIPVSASRCAQD